MSAKCGLPLCIIIRKALLNDAAMMIMMMTTRNSFHVPSKHSLQESHTIWNILRGSGLGIHHRRSRGLPTGYCSGITEYEDQTAGTGVMQQGELDPLETS